MLTERFWNKVNKNTPTDCWEWTGVVNGKKGYGMFSCRKLGFYHKQLSHRLSYMHHYGPIPKGLLVLHECDNPKCVNPAHLWLGTHADNVRDMDSKSRRVSNSRKGESNPCSTLTNALVISMRKDYCQGMFIKDICAKYTVNYSGACDAIRGKSWKHLLGKNGSPSLEDIKEAAKNARTRSGKMFGGQNRKNHN